MQEIMKYKISLPSKKETKPWNILMETGWIQDIKNILSIHNELLLSNFAQKL